MATAEQCVIPLLLSPSVQYLYLHVEAGFIAAIYLRFRLFIVLISES